MSAASWFRGSKQLCTRRFFACLLTCIGASGALLLSGCGGSGSSSMTNSSMGGTVITVTDAAGDFQNYIVNVTSLQLTRSDGTVAETVTTGTQGDVAQLVDLSEILSTAQVPAGQYTSVAMTL